MNLLDWLLLVLVLAYALSGYWQGFVTGAFATAGLLVGGLAGVLLAPLALGDANPSLLVSLGALFIVVLAASLGQGIFSYVGTRVRNKITWRPVRVVDALGGSVLSAAAVLIVAWALGIAISGSSLGSATQLVRNSAVLSGVDKVLPQSAGGLLQTFNNVVGTSFFPRYLEPFAPERIVPVGPGPKKLLTRPAVEAAGRSVLKIQGNNQCGRGVEGSGFLFAPDRLMTNAHVVAGVDRPQVEVDGRFVPARTVYYNPDVDIAVLAVRSGDLPTLDFDTSGKEREGVVVLGYPLNGPYDQQAARIRTRQQLRSPDIYGDGTVIREVFSLRGLIRPGNSGGPVVDRQGEVVGVVFAASVTDQETGYALTADQVDDLAAAGERSEQVVSTQGCAA